jgi:hypothetical protein
VSIAITDDGAAQAPKWDAQRPMLRRTLGGKPLGTPLALTFRDKPIRGVESIFIDLVWSGTRVLYPFWTTYEKPPYYVAADWFLLPIDCRR